MLRCTGCCWNSPVCLCPEIHALPPGRALHRHAAPHPHQPRLPWLQIPKTAGAGKKKKKGVKMDPALLSFGTGTNYAGVPSRARRAGTHAWGLLRRGRATSAACMPRWRDVQSGGGREGQALICCPCPGMQCWRPLSERRFTWWRLTAARSAMRLA